jgi:hypothetical protein
MGSSHDEAGIFACLRHSNGSFDFQAVTIDRKIICNVKNKAVNFAFRTIIFPSQAEASLEEQNISDTSMLTIL